MPSHDGQEEEQDGSLCLRGGISGEGIKRPRFVACLRSLGIGATNPSSCDSVSDLTPCLFFLCKTLRVMHLNVNVALTNREGATEQGASHMFNNVGSQISK